MEVTAALHDYAFAYLPALYEIEYGTLPGEGVLAGQCEWYAARTNDEEDRKFLLRKAKHWTKLAAEKELEIRCAHRKMVSAQVLGYADR